MDDPPKVAGWDPSILPPSTSLPHDFPPLIATILSLRNALLPSETPARQSVTQALVGSLVGGLLGLPELSSPATQTPAETPLDPTPVEGSRKGSGGGLCLVDEGGRLKDDIILEAAAGLNPQALLHGLWLAGEKGGLDFLPPTGVLATALLLAGALGLVPPEAPAAQSQPESGEQVRVGFC